MFLMPEQPVLEIGKSFELFAAFRRKDSPVLVEIFGSSTAPGTFGDGEHIRIEVILFDDVRFRLDHPVVPDGQDRPGEIVTALRLVVDTAVIEGEQVGERIEVIQVMEAGIDGGNPFLRFPAITPQMRHVYFSRFVVPAGVPGYYFFPFGTDISDHFGYEIRVCELHLVRSDVQVRNVECFAYFVQQEL